MKNWREYFAGKRVTVMGLGLLGRGVGDAVFLAECGAELTITDLKTAEQLHTSLEEIQQYKDIRYTLGRHELKDFIDKDFILKAAGVPLDSPYIAEARKHGIPIEMDASLFARFMPKGAPQHGSGQVILIGVTGTRGKSTVTALIYEILQGSALVGKKVEPCKIYKGGNLVPEATLPLLKKVRAGDIVVLELDSWQLQGFHDAKISPQIAVFTTFLDDHLVYYKGDRARYFADKTAIFKYQKKGDVLIVGERVSDALKGSTLNLKNGRTLRTARMSDVPKDWNIPLLGEHNRENIACALAVARALGVSDVITRKAVENFKPVPGRLEFLREIKGVKIYNDNNATTPDATLAALKALSPQGPPQGSTLRGKVEPCHRIILLMGGTDKGLDMSKLISAIPEYCKAVILLDETGTDKLIFNYQFPIFKKNTLKACVEKAMNLAKKGDIILFSPAFASFGRWFKNEYDRGAQFVKIIRNL